MLWNDVIARTIKTPHINVSLPRIPLLYRDGNGLVSNPYYKQQTNNVPLSINKTVPLSVDSQPPIQEVQQVNNNVVRPSRKVKLNVKRRVPLTVTPIKPPQISSNDGLVGLNEPKIDLNSVPVGYNPVNEQYKQEYIRRHGALPKDTALDQPSIDPIDLATFNWKGLVTNPIKTLVNEGLGNYIQDKITDWFGL